jgi:lipopolysaccharide export system ATP-binding protein
MNKKGLFVQELSKKYSGKAVVQGLSLHVLPGEVVGLLGPNGAGKTTVFHMIIGLIKCDEGEVIFDDQNISKMPIHERSRLGLGYLAQEPSVFRDLTVEQNLITVLELIEPNEEAIASRKSSLLTELGLLRHAKKKASHLSGGERRRLEIARALATKPSLLLLDEPFANIDPLAIADVRAMIKLLQNKGIGVLITDHNAREIISIVDRAYLVADGKVLKHGNAQELLADNEARARYFGEEFSL